MKYAIPLDNDNNPMLDRINGFDEETYYKIISKGRKGKWIPYPGEHVFISFCDADRQLMKVLKSPIHKSDLLQPLIVEEKRKGAIHLSELVQNGIRESSFFIPILTSNSISNQWVNQEIGFAKAIENQIQIVPIVESKIIEKLKGFIHKQIQLSYNFRVYEEEDRTKRAYRKICKEVVSYIEQEVLNMIQRNQSAV